MRDNLQVRANVRKAYADRTSNPQHRGAWGNSGVYRLFGSYAGAWPFFGPVGKVIMTVSETYHEIYSLSSVSTRPGVAPVSMEDETDASLTFSAEVARGDVVYKDYQIEPADGTVSETDQCVRTHGSATPYGEGLYDMAGSFMVDGEETRTVYQRRETSDGYEGTEVITERTRKIVQYRTQNQMLDGVLQTPKIRGLNTRIRMTLPQHYHGPNFVQAPIGAPGPPIPIEPFEKNPDGEELEGTAVELYWTDLVAKVLQAGAWSPSMVRISGGGGDSYDEEDDDGYILTTSYSNSFTRGGEVELFVVR